MLKSPVPSLLPLLLPLALVAELASLIWVGQIIGVIPTIVLLLVSAVVGVGLLRFVSLEVLTTLTRGGLVNLSSRQFQEVVLGRAVAGFLFLVPGFFSDLAGLLILLPWVRRQVLSRLAPGRMSWPPHGPGPEARGPVIEGEVVEIVTILDDQQLTSRPTKR
jgi:UPF0716 protein FxsA